MPDLKNKIKRGEQRNEKQRDAQVSQKGRDTFLSRLPLNLSAIIITETRWIDISRDERKRWQD